MLERETTSLRDLHRINPLFWAGFVLCEALKEYCLSSQNLSIYYHTSTRERVTVCNWPMTRTVVCAINTTVIKGHTATTATPGLGE